MVKKTLKKIILIFGAVTMFCSTYALSVSAEHVHTWKNVSETVDVYKEQPIYEEVPIYEEIPIIEVHKIVQDATDPSMIGFDVTAEITQKGINWNQWQDELYKNTGIFIWNTAQRYVQVGTEKIQIGTETVQTGTKTVKTGTQQEVCRVCTVCEAAASAVGDLSGDKIFDFLDLVQLAKLLMPNINPTSQQTELADMNQNGTIDFLDLVMLSNEIMPKYR